MPPTVCQPLARPVLLLAIREVRKQISAEDIDHIVATANRISSRVGCLNTTGNSIDQRHTHLPGRDGCVAWKIDAVRSATTKAWSAQTTTALSVCPGSNGSLVFVPVCFATESAQSSRTPHDGLAPRSLRPTWRGEGEGGWGGGTEGGRVLARRGFRRT